VIGCVQIISNVTSYSLGDGRHEAKKNNRKRLWRRWLWRVGHRLVEKAGNGKINKLKKIKRK